MSTLTSKVTIAQLGCGYWGPNLLRTLVSQRQCHSVWMAETSPQRRKYVEENFPQVKISDQADNIFLNDNIDAVVIATPASTHFTLAKRALLSGKHVFVEKPLAMSTSDADELVDLSQRKNLVLMAGHTFLYNSAVRYLKGLIDSSEMGQLFYIYSNRLNLGQVRTDVNAWWNLGPHDVSILLYLMGGALPDSIQVRGLDFIQRGIADVIFVTLTWPSHVLAHIHLSWLDPHKVRNMTVVGSKKMVTYDDIAEDKIAIFNKRVERVPVIGEMMDFDKSAAFQLCHRAGDVLLPKIEYEEPLKVELAHFIECVRTGKPPLTGPFHARDVVAILEAGQQSLESGELVRIQQKFALAA